MKLEGSEARSLRYVALQMIVNTLGFLAAGFACYHAMPQLGLPQSVWAPTLAFWALFSIWFWPMLVFWWWNGNFRSISLEIRNEGARQTGSAYEFSIEWQDVTAVRRRGLIHPKLELVTNPFPERFETIPLRWFSRADQELITKLIDECVNLHAQTSHAA
jgi:hypothetical protein